MKHGSRAENQMSGVRYRGTNETAWRQRLDAPRMGGAGLNSKMRGTLGILGTLAKFLVKFAWFSRVPKSANGTLGRMRKTELKIADRSVVSCQLNRTSDEHTDDDFE